MSNFIMHVELLAGTSIEEAIEEARKKCIQLDLAYINFNFNGVEMSVGKYADVDSGVKAFDQTMRDNSKGKKYVVENGRTRF